uniref:Reverse transcriptase zinc-binding domain-containing protein n=1 Tax=Triticum urartu TaxID=4572 RepID=A0A8R7QJG2_TRIUA
PQRGHTILQHVAELINPVTGSWDSELVNEIFWQQDARTILAIPLLEDFEDIWAWHFDDKGRFSVKSAYHMLREKQEQQAKRQVGEASDQIEKFKWSEIWKCCCPPKMKHFLWRLAHN